MITNKGNLSETVITPDSINESELFSELHHKHINWKFLLTQVNKDSKTNKKDEKVTFRTYDWHDKVILIAEDEEANFLFLKAALSITQAIIIRAKNGREAVELAKTNPEIDLVLMDIKMPVMNGVDATRVIKTINNNMVIIAQTAYATENDRYIYLNAGCTDFLAKPITRDKLLRTISQYLE